MHTTLLQFTASAVEEEVAGGRLLIYDPIAPKNLFPSPHIHSHLIKCSFSSFSVVPRQTSNVFWGNGAEKKFGT